MARTDVWMPLYIGDYLADTTRLTTTEHGAYLLLIMDYWRNGPPPDDDAILARICRMDDSAWSNASSTLRGFFKHSDGRLTHARIEAEMEAAETKKAAAVAKAERAAGARWSKNASSNSSSNATSTDQAMLKPCPSPSPSPSPLQSTSTSTSTPESTAKSKPLQPALPAAPKKSDVPSEDTTLQAVCRETWRAYGDAYALRYAVEPVRNSKINGQVKQFCQRVPHDEAPAIAAFFVGHHASFYVAKGHAFGLLLADAEKLRTEWATNRKVTAIGARQQERAGAMGDIVNEIIMERGGVA